MARLLEGRLTREEVHRFSAPSVERDAQTSDAMVSREVTVLHGTDMAYTAAALQEPADGRVARFLAKPDRPAHAFLGFQHAQPIKGAHRF